MYIINIRNNMPALISCHVRALVTPKRPKGSQAPVKVNSHHLNLSAPPINTKLCQKLRWMRAVQGWVVFDKMCEWWNAENVSTSFPGCVRVNYVEEMSASAEHGKQGQHLWLCKWVCGDFGHLATLKLKQQSLSQLITQVAKPFYIHLHRQRGKGLQNGKLQE